jgi:peptidoglycan/xylan/chitin deacetylase (PgdA/CDA1 family)
MVFRSDRFATLYFFHRIRRLEAQEPRIPILMYHRVSDVDESERHPYYRTATAPKVFEKHMRFLYEHDYKPITLTDAERRLREETSAREREVVITFDDGFQDFYTDAFPVLRKYGFSATMFLPTAYIDHDSRKFKGVNCMTWSQIRELQRAGIQFGSHTVTHPQLKNLAPKEIEEEIRCSKQRIEEELGSPVTSFAYPYAFPETDSAFRQQLGELLEKTGYENGVSTIVGTADRAGGRFFMKRLPVNSCDDVALFRAKLEGGYDWLHTLQYASKLVTARH